MNNQARYAGPVITVYKKSNAWTRTAAPKPMDHVQAIMRVKRYSPRTVKTYCYWIRYFIRFHGMRHPASMGATEVQTFFEHLAVARHVRRPRAKP